MAGKTEAQGGSLPSQGSIDSVAVRWVGTQAWLLPNSCWFCCGVLAPQLVVGVRVDAEGDEQV